MIGASQHLGKKHKTSHERLPLRVLIVDMVHRRNDEGTVS